MTAFFFPELSHFFLAPQRFSDSPHSDGTPGTEITIVEIVQS